MKRSFQSLALKDLILQRKETNDVNNRKVLSKQIHRQARKELRQWKSKWAEYLLTKFENTKHLQKIMKAPIQSSACPIDKEAFGSFLGSLFSSPNPLLPNDADKMMIRSIQSFTLEELETVLKGMKNLKSADDEGIVIEMIKYANETFKIALITLFNQSLEDGLFDESWYTSILQMLPKDGDLNELKNWRPIALLPIFYKIFSKLIYYRISSYLFSQQSFDQHGFTPGIRIEDALLCAEVVIEHHLEFNLELWLLSMDMRKAFDTIDHHALMQSLRSKGLPDAYISLLSVMYTNQKASANGSSKFPIQRGVKQGDTLSAILFNCVLDIAFDTWRLSLANEGILIAHGLQRLTNIRYADDILLYAKSLDELLSMTEKLTAELKKIGLTLNTEKTKILRCNPEPDKAAIGFAELDDDFVMVLDDNESHRYLGKKLSISGTNRNLIEFKSRKQIAWMAFGKHIKVLLDHNISLQLRLKYFDACVGPAILFGTAVLPMTRTQLQDLDRLQRKMLRRIVGWRRIEGEDWRDTMVRMNQRLSRAEQLYFCQPWSISFARNQWKYIFHLIDAYPLLWARIMLKFNFNPVYDPEASAIPYRMPGRPRLRWDDHIHGFCWKTWPQYHGRHWFDILSHTRNENFEDEYVLYLCSERMH